MIDIIKAAQNGDTVAMDKAVQENMGLVHTLSIDIEMG